LPLLTQAARGTGVPLIGPILAFSALTLGMVVAARNQRLSPPLRHALGVAGATSAVCCLLRSDGPHVHGAQTQTMVRRSRPHPGRPELGGLRRLARRPPAAADRHLLARSTSRENRYLAGFGSRGQCSTISSTIRAAPIDSGSQSGSSRCAASTAVSTSVAT